MGGLLRREMVESAPVGDRDRQRVGGGPGRQFDESVRDWNRRGGLFPGILPGNTDAEHAITLEKADYFDTDGRLVKHFVEEPVQVAPMATVEFFVEERDTRGGSGANFLVDWSADEPVDRLDPA